MGYTITSVGRDGGNHVYDGDAGGTLAIGPNTGDDVFTGGNSHSEDESKSYFLKFSPFPAELMVWDRTAETVTPLASLPSYLAYANLIDAVTASRNRVFVALNVMNADASWDVRILTYNLSGALLNNEIVANGVNTNPDYERIGLAHDWSDTGTHTSEVLADTGGSTWLMRSWKSGTNQLWRVSTLFDGGQWNDYDVGGSGRVPSGYSVLQPFAAVGGKVYVTLNGPSGYVLREYQPTLDSGSAGMTREWSMADGVSTLGEPSTLAITRDGAYAYWSVWFPSSAVTLLLRMDLATGVITRLPVGDSEFRFIDVMLADEDDLCEPIQWWDGTLLQDTTTTYL